MKKSVVIIENGVEGQRYKIHAHIEESPIPNGGITLKITSTYEDSRNPEEHRVLYKQHFPSQEDFNRFAKFIGDAAWGSYVNSTKTTQDGKHPLKLK